MIRLLFKVAMFNFEGRCKKCQDNVKLLNGDYNSEIARGLFEDIIPSVSEDTEKSHKQY
jgi:hypothetical protein